MDEIDMTPERWERTERWIEGWCGDDAPWYRDVMRRAEAAGLPSIDAGITTARMLAILLRALGGRCAVEVGTLAGATTVILARALAAGGRVITAETNATHATFARTIFAEAGVSERIDLREGPGDAVLRALRGTAAGSVDLIFLDARREDYVGMLPDVRTLLRPGGMLAIDNALSAGRWLPDPPKPGAKPDPMDAVCEAVRRDPAFLSTVLPVGNGVLLATRVA